MSKQSLDSLKKLVIDQKTANLPPEPEPAMEDLHQALITYDQIISPLVISAIQERAFVLPEGQLAEVEAALDQKFASLNDQANRRVDLYQAYRSRLNRMVDLLEELSRQPGNQEQEP